MDEPGLKEPARFTLLDGGRPKRSFDEQAHDMAVATIEATQAPSVPVRRARELVPPPISKSGVRAMECPVYYVGEYAQPITNSTHFLLITGQEFHDYKLVYIRHLIRTQQPSDDAFREEYLRTQPLSTDVRKLIADDDSTVNPEEIWDAEVYLSVDYAGNALRRRSGSGHELYPTENPFVHGILDLLLLSDLGPQGFETATIKDWKSGYSTTGIHDAEPKIYAALVFAHWPSVQTVTWSWEFPRLGLVKRVEYKRADLEWIWSEIRTYASRSMQMVKQYNAGRELLPRPESGLCTYCNLACPMRPRWEAGELAIGPPQTQEDKQRLARLLIVCEAVIQRVRKVLRGPLDAEGTVELENGWEVSLQTTEKCSYPVVDALHTLGLGVVDITNPAVAEAVLPHEPTTSPLYDVPLKRLTLGGTSGFAKTKKRAGWREELLAEGVNRTLTTKIKTGKQEVMRVIEAVHDEEEEDPE